MNFNYDGLIILNQSDLYELNGGANWWQIAAGFLTGVGGVITCATGVGAVAGGTMIYCGGLMVIDGIGW